jgi:hypothetical protein
MLFFITWYRRHGIFWSDEIMGWTTLVQPTWRQLIRVWWSGVDSSGLLFYVFARPWLKTFGWTEFSLHLWSTFFVSLSMLVTWICARRTSPLGVVALVIPFVYMFNRIMIIQLSNGRAYGILLLAVALASYAMLRTDPMEQDFRGPRPVLISFAAFLMLVGSHTLGMLFWGVFLAGFVFRDLLFRVFQWKVYVAAVVAFLLIVPISLRNIQATIAMGKPTFWTAIPTTRDFFLGFGDFSIHITLLLGLTLLAFFVLFYSQPKTTRGPLIPRSRVSFYCLLAVFPTLQIIMFVLSLLGKSIFINRYLIPISIGDILLLCELFTRILQIRPVTRVVSVSIACGGGLLLIALFLFNLRREGPPAKDYTSALLRCVPAGKPIIITDVSVFIETIHYRNNERELLSPLDWSVQLDPNFGVGGASFLHELEDWKSVGIYADHILPTQRLLATYPSFVLVSDEEHTLWFRRYIESNPAYRVVELPRCQGDRTWDVVAR